MRRCRYFTDVQRDELWESHVRQNKALVYLAANANQRAELELEKALRLRSVDVDPVGHADTLAELAELALRTGNPERARELVQQALEILGEDTAYARTKAELHDIAARMLRISGDYDAAKERHVQAISLYETAAYARGLAEAKTGYAATLATSGQVDAALAELDSALALAEQVADRLLQFKIAVSRGSIQLGYGDPAVALESGASALSMSEDIRDTIVDPRLLREFAARQREAADVVVGAAITRDDLRNEFAWRTADDARARYFAASLRQAGLDQSRLDEEQQALYRSLLLMRAARIEERSELLSLGKSTEASAIDDELTEIVDQIELLQSRARTPAAPAPLAVSVDNLQTRLDPGEVLLEYYFGEFSSGVWKIGRDDIAYVELPPLDAISPMLESVLASVRTLSPRRNEKLLELSQLLLGPLKHSDDEATHIIVVADGPLHYLPFSILLDPGTNYEHPLVESRAVSYLPSVRSLLELESRQTVQGKGIAVIADPVFTWDDERAGKDRKAPTD